MVLNREEKGNGRVGRRKFFFASFAEFFATFAVKSF